jgi:hypothetical protein
MLQRMSNGTRFLAIGDQDAGTDGDSSVAGQHFMTFIISELFKSQLNRGERPAFSFRRDSSGNEVDLIVEQGNMLMPIEIKSGKTMTRDSFAGVEAPG